MELLMKANLVNRRHFLRAAGTIVALPTLESIGFRRFASAADSASHATEACGVPRLWLGSDGGNVDAGCKGDRD